MKRFQALLFRRARIEPGTARRIDLLERFGLRNIPAKQANSGRGKQRRAERGALAHLGPHDLEPGNIREYLHRKVPVRHPAVHLQVREICSCVKHHALHHCARLVRVRLERSPRYVCRRRV